MDGCRSLYERVLQKTLCSQKANFAPSITTGMHPAMALNVQKIVKMPGINLYRNKAGGVQKAIQNHNIQHAANHRKAPTVSAPTSNCAIKSIFLRY